MIIPIDKTKSTLKTDKDQLEVKVGYGSGGINYFSGDESKRGYYVFLRLANQEKQMRTGLE